MFADTARGKVCDFAFLTSSGGKFLITIALAIPPLTVKNRGGGGALTRDCALNWANTVSYHPTVRHFQPQNPVPCTSCFC